MFLVTLFIIPIALATPLGEVCADGSGKTDLKSAALLQQRAWKSKGITPLNGFEELAHHPDPECDDEVGRARLERYTAVGEEFCHSSGGSSFSCAAIWTEWSSEKAQASDFACRGRNLGLTVQTNKSIRLRGQQSCQWTLPKDGLDLKYHIFSDHPIPLELDESEYALSCDETMDYDTLMVYSEDDFWNPFINQAQMIMAYTTLLAMSLDPTALRVLFTRKTSSSPLVELVVRAFSKEGSSALEPADEARTICAKNVIIPAGGQNSWIRKHANMQDPWAERCNNAPLLRGYSEFLKHSFHVVPTPASGQERVTLLLREPSKVHPARFKRHMTNAGELAGALEGNTTEPNVDLILHATEDQSLKVHHFSLALATALRAKGAHVTEAQLETMPIAEQIALFANSDVVISAHSAALSWLLLVPQCSQILEFCTGGDFQFVNYAKLAGREHRCMDGLTGGWGTDDFEAPISTVTKAVVEAVERWRKCSS